jgi:hypothetical protein
MKNQLNLKLKVALAFARRGNKAKAMMIAEETLNEYGDKFLVYVWNSRVKNQLKKPVNLTEKERLTFKKRMVQEKLAEFNKIIADV